MGAVWPLEGI